MSEEFILHYIPRRTKQLGYQKYHIRYKDMVVAAGSGTTIEAFNELFFVIGDPMGIILESDYGTYDSTGYSLSENEHQHKGIITITNPGNDDKRVKFVEVILVG